MLPRWQLVVKNPPTNQETQELWIQPLGLEEPREEEMATCQATVHEAAKSQICLKAQAHT